MNKAALLKIIILIIALLAVVTAVFVAMNAIKNTPTETSKTFFVQFIVDGGEPRAQGDQPGEK